MGLQKNLSELIRDFFDTKFSTDFSINKVNEIETKNSLGDFAVISSLRVNENFYTFYYFIDRKFIKNIIKVMISELSDFVIADDFIEKSLFELNNQIVKHLKKHNFQIEVLDQNIIKEYNSKISETPLKIRVNSLHSAIGDLLIAFGAEENYKKMNTLQKKSTNSNYTGNTILQVKDKAEDSPTNSIISAVQLLEIKKQVLTSLNEIKDLRGDSEFLLRKAKAVTDLTKLWFDILREEN